MLGLDLQPDFALALGARPEATEHDTALGVGEDTPLAAERPRAGHAAIEALLLPVVRV